jgi:predicted DNA-binding antitoxin AbrB/MazE fold protein
MPQQVEVIYENGVLRPLGPLPAELHERQRYTVTLEAAGDHEARLDAACMAAAARDATPAVSLEDVRRVLAKVHGTLAEAVAAEREER